MYSNTHHTKTLADLLDGGRRMTAEEIFSIIFPTLHILKDMHRRGKVHGHISPDCIVLEDNDRLLFCCPLNTAAQTRLLKSIQVSGTSFCRMISLTDSSVDFAAEAAPYRALETYMSGPLTPAADVYSLCAVICRAITGLPPKTAQEKMYGGQPALSASDAAGSDIGLTDILNKGMALLPGGRYADAGELAASLEIYRAKVRENNARTEALSHLVTVLNRIASSPVRLTSILRRTAAQIPEFTLSSAQPTLSADFLNILVEELKKSDRNFSRNNITSITFLNRLEYVPLQWADVSVEGDGSIAAWAEKNTANGYAVYVAVFVAAEGTAVHTGHHCSGMFAECKNLKTIDFGSNFNTSASENMSSMFYMTPSLLELDLSCFNTSRVKNMNRMFFGCRSLRGINLESFDTSHVTDMSYMFCGCSQLTALKFKTFDTSNVRNMQYMFCTSFNLNLKKIFAAFDFSKVNADNFSYIAGGTSFEDELINLSRSLSSQPPIWQLLKPLDRVRLLCEDFEAKYPKRYSTGISNVLKTGLGLTDEKVYLSHDDTWLKSGKNGFAVTDRGFVCRNFSGNPQALSFKDFKAVKEITPITSKLSDANILAGGQPIVYVTGASDTEKNDLNHLIQSIQKTL